MSVSYNGTLVDNIVVNDTNIVTPRTYYTQNELDSIATAVSQKSGGGQITGSSVSSIINDIGNIELGNDYAAINILCENLLKRYGSNYTLSNQSIGAVYFIFNTNRSYYPITVEYIVNTSVSTKNGVNFEYFSWDNNVGASSDLKLYAKKNCKLKVVSVVSMSDVGYPDHNVYNMGPADNSSNSISVNQYIRTDKSSSAYDTSSMRSFLRFYSYTSTNLSGLAGYLMFAPN